METNKIKRITESIERLKKYNIFELQRIYNDYLDDLMYLDLKIKKGYTEKIRMSRAIIFGNQLYEIIRTQNDRKKNIQLKIDFEYDDRF